MEPGTPIFGTDGVRDRAGEGLLTASSVARLARATAAVLEARERFAVDFPGGAAASGASHIVLGRDTRASGEDIGRLFSGVASESGLDVTDVGVLPTPGVAYLTRQREDAVLGVMVSASHNPAEYNGIKFFAPTGAKVSEDFERGVSEAYWQDVAPAGSGRAGRVRSDGESAGAYIDSLVAAAQRPEAFVDLHVVLDMAHGATVTVAREVFERLGARVEALGDAPDGTNINAGCGALHAGALGERVRERGAQIGFAFDGDGDRMIPVAEDGEVLDGDFVLAIVGHSLKRLGRLPTNTLVTTVMANFGLEKAAADAGIHLVRTPVGDRHVFREMERGGHVLGGEQSGHIIFLDDARTGDGVLAAIRLVDSLRESGQTLGASSAILRRYPQILLNYRVARKVPLEDLDDVQEAVRRAEDSLAGEGRIVLRYSGTEPLVRVMVEGPDAERIAMLAETIGQTILASLEAR